MSRAVRTARGTFGALAATVLAAASHSLAGGTSTLVAVVATAVFALPLCVLLAGRVGSLWRLAAAVVPAQFAFHWMFASLGVVSVQPGGAAEAVSPHAAHLGLLSSLTPANGASSAATLASAGSADLLMWVSHALAAAVTITLMHWGERAALQLMRVLRQVLPIRVPGSFTLPDAGAQLTAISFEPVRLTQVWRSASNTRGPPLGSFSHT